MEFLHKRWPQIFNRATTEKNGGFSGGIWEFLCRKIDWGWCHFSTLSHPQVLWTNLLFSPTTRLTLRSFPQSKSFPQVIALSYSFDVELRCPLAPYKDLNNLTNVLGPISVLYLDFSGVHLDRCNEIGITRGVLTSFSLLFTFYNFGGKIKNT